MKIKKIIAREILDSRGEPTIEVVLSLANGIRAIASVPHGKSAGSYEAVHIPAHRAVSNINRIIAKKLQGIDLRDQKNVDTFLCSLDGSKNKKRLGGNALLGVSIAAARAFALVAHVPLWKYIRAQAGSAARNTEGLHLFINMINGGVHAGNNLNFQEYLLIPKTKNLHDAVMLGARLYHELGLYMCKVKGNNACNIGDEGGYAPMFKNNLEPFGMFRTVAKRLNVESKISFGLDVAANEARLQKETMNTLYARMFAQYPISYIEDPFKENDFSSFRVFRKTITPATLVAGDDLTATNVARMKKAHEEESVNSIIIKPNQIGTISESIAAVSLARKYKWRVIVSHRSGETNDDFIADFAYGVRAYGLKLGAPARGERIAKYNRLLEIEHNT